MIPLAQYFAERERRAAEARAEAEAERRRRRLADDRYVNGGVNWDGYSLESLIHMVADRANPGQLSALAGEWRQHGGNIGRSAEDLHRSLTKLMRFWSGSAADEAYASVTRNSVWISELGNTAVRIAGPVEESGYALRSAQDTMPGMPKNSWYLSAGGGALAGFAIAGPIGAAFGAVIGGIGSLFGFGSKKKKMKRKAVQTMQRFEGEMLGIDQTTPQFGDPSDGVNPGTDPIRPPGWDGVGSPDGLPPVYEGENPDLGPPPAVDPPHGPPPVNHPGDGGLTPGHGGTDPSDFGWSPNQGTIPSFAESPEGRWQGLTGGGGSGGYGPGYGGAGGGANPGTGPGAGGGLYPGMGGRPGGGYGTGGRGVGRGVGPGYGGAPAGGARSGDRTYRPRPGLRTPGGTTASGARGTAGRGGMSRGYGAVPPGGAGRGRGGEDGEHRTRTSLARGGANPGGGAGVGGMAPGVGAGRGGNRDGEHRTRAAVARGMSPGGGPTAGIGAVPGGAAGRGGRDSEYQPRGRFGRAGGLGGGFAPMGAGGSRGEGNGEHRRRVPIEEDPFSTDQKATPPVIGL